MFCSIFLGNSPHRRGRKFPDHKLFLTDAKGNLEILDQSKRGDDDLMVAVSFGHTHFFSRVSFPLAVRFVLSLCSLRFRLRIPVSVIKADFLD